MLRDLGAHVIDADAVAHDLERKGAPVYDAIVAAFGESILRTDGEIDRAQLGVRVFSDPQALRRLEAIVHPAVGKAIEKRLSDLPRARPISDVRTVVVIEAIKLIEAGLHQRCDALWVVTCRPGLQLDRLMRTRGLNEADARLRIVAQPPQSDKAALADVLIENNGTVDELGAQVKHHWEQIFQGK
jgi:dephospho-CoA kinase